MTMLDEAQLPQDDEPLPPEVLQALRGSVVAGIRALQKSRGIGLYEAKQLIDSHLGLDIAHPSTIQSKNQQSTSEHQSQHTRTIQKYPWQREPFIPASTVLGEPIELASLPNRAFSPGAYVLASAPESADRRWYADALKVCFAESLDPALLKVVDEELRNEKGDVASVAIKLPGPISSTQLHALAGKLRQRLANDVNCRVLIGCPREEAALPAQELEVEYFVHEFARPGRMSYPGTSCVKLTHIPTGLTARSTSDRNRFLNYEEALLLLCSLISGANEI